MLKGIVIVDSSGLPRYSYIDPSIDPVTFAGFVNAIQTVLQHLLNQKLKKIETGETQLIASSVGDMDIILLADKEDDDDLLMQYSARIAEWVKNAIKNTETHKIVVDSKNEMVLLGIMESYRTEYLQRRLKAALQRKELLGWMDDKKLGALLEVIILRGKIEINGPSELQVLVNYFAKSGATMPGVKEITTDKYYYKLDYDSRKVETNAPNKIGPILAKLLKKNEFDTVAEMISNTYRIANRIYLIYKKKASPREIIDDLTQYVGNVKYKDALFEFGAIFAGVLFNIDEKEVRKIIDKIKIGLFMEAF